MGTKLDYQTVKNMKTPGRFTDLLVRGLHLWVKNASSKYWIFRYTAGGKQRDLMIGAFPAVSVAEARLKAENAREELRLGSDPWERRLAAKAARRAPEVPTANFECFARSYVENKRPQWTNRKHADQWLNTLSTYAFPRIGNLKVNEIDTQDILAVLNPIWLTKTETASRLRSRIELILASAAAQRLREGQNPASWKGHLETILPSAKRVKRVVHHAALSYQALPDFINRLREFDYVGALALEFLILNASRTGEVIGALREEVDGDLWTIPASRMKAKKEHRVPLCSRSIELIHAARARDPDSRYLFSRFGKQLSNMSMAMVLRKINPEVTVHGFRSTFRDWVSEETDHSPEVAEMALAHSIGNRVEAAYRRKDLLLKRRLLMSDWDLFCCGSKSTKVLKLKAA